VPATSGHKPAIYSITSTPPSSEGGIVTPTYEPAGALSPWRNPISRTFDRCAQAESGHTATPAKQSYELTSSHRNHLASHSMMSRPERIDHPVANDSRVLEVFPTRCVATVVNRRGAPAFDSHPTVVASHGAANTVDLPLSGAGKAAGIYSSDISST
jgi:hypothetical protein